MKTASDPASLAHDFEVLLRYVDEQKVIVTPKQQFIPVRHVRNMMANFRVKERHGEKIGNRIYQKREEMEYPRFYFLDLLAVGGGFLKLSRKGRIVKGPNWRKFFETPVEERPFLLFQTFRTRFDFDAWFLRGGDFGVDLTEKSEAIWSHIMKWQDDGCEIEWEGWALQVIRNCDLHWDSENQTFARETMIWALKCCLVEPMRYFGVLKLRFKPGEYAPELAAVRLNSIGVQYFKKLESMFAMPSSLPPWFSPN